MDQEKTTTETDSDDTAAETPEATAKDTVETAPAETQDKQLWRDGLVQEALGARPELRTLATKKDYAASRKVGHDLGFEDAARKLTVDQLQSFQALLDRRIASYARHELPGDLRGYLDERGVGLDEKGFLAGYVDGVGDFLSAYKEQLNRQPQ